MKTNFDICDRIDIDLSLRMIKAQQKDGCNFTFSSKFHQPDIGAAACYPC